MLWSGPRQGEQTMKAWSMNRIGLGGVALIAAFGFAACNDEEDAPGNGTSGSAGAAEGGQPEGGTKGTAGKGGGGTASVVAGAGLGGEPSPAGTSGESGSGVVSGAGAPAIGGEAGAAGGAGAPAVDPDATLRLLFEGTSPLPALPGDTTNQYADDADAAALGQKFFFDKKFSGKLRADGDLTLGNVDDVGKVACQTCHAQTGMDDGKPVSLGTGKHTRNAPALINSSFYTWTNWGGRFSAQWELPIAVVENPVTMNGTRLAVAHRIFSAYKAEYEAVFGTTLPDALGSDTARFPLTGKPKPAPTVDVPNPPDGAWEGMAADDKLLVNRMLVNFGKALEAYTRKLVSRQAPFDDFMAGNADALSASAKNGALLFAGKAGCISCHHGPSFSDQGFHVLGVGTGDDGRFKDLPGLLTSPFNRNGDFSDDKTTSLLNGLTNPPPDSTKGAFRTAGLRGVALTAPYMHAGSKATLSEVIDFYAVAGTLNTGAGELAPFAITPGEKADLIAFLGSLTGQAVPSGLLVDTSAP